MKLVKLCILFCFCISCVGPKKDKKSKPVPVFKTSLVVLGTVQDAGSPHIACKKDCCTNLFENPMASRKVVSLGLVDVEAEKTYLFDATPDITEQLKTLKTRAPFEASEIPNGIFLTHAHIGHYTGLMYLGKEAKDAKDATVFAMPKMKSFLESNGPWSQLVTNNNIELEEVYDDGEIVLSPNLKVIPFRVPHRDEYSETVGFKIIGPNKKVLFIPDIDKWEKWETNIIDALALVDFALLDGSFFSGNEINHRDISEIPHPAIVESMRIFETLSDLEKKKIHFIHFNHTNPILDSNSKQSHEVLNKGFHIARKNDIIEL
jgi:pyrroloquinoline quinone biosynthesis protein B